MDAGVSVEWWAEPDGPSPLTIRMSIRRFTRLTKAFSKKLDNHKAALALHFMHYNFARVHKTLRVTPAMEAGARDHVWDSTKSPDSSFKSVAEAVIAQAAKVCGVAQMTCYASRFTREQSQQLRNARYGRPRGQDAPPSLPT